MAFYPVTLTTSQLLETTYVSDMRLIFNSNTDLFKDKIESLINNLMIDLDSNTIGVAATANSVPIDTIKTKYLKIQDGGLTLSKGTGTPVIEFSLAGASGNIGQIKTGTLISTDATSGITAARLQVAGSAVFNGPVSAAPDTNASLAGLSITQGFATSFDPAITVTMNAGSNNTGSIDLELTANTPSVILLDIEMNTTSLGTAWGTLPAALNNGFDIQLKNSTTSPIKSGQVFTIMIRSYSYVVSGTRTYIDWPTIVTNPSSTVIRVVGRSFAIANQTGIPALYDPASADRWVIGLDTRPMTSSVTFVNVGQIPGNFNQVQTPAWTANSNERRLMIQNFTPNCPTNSTWIVNNWTNP